MLSIANTLLLISAVISQPTGKGAKGAGPKGLPPTPTDDQLCGCYNLQEVSNPVIDNNEICYYYRMRQTSDSAYCQSIEYFTIGSGDIDQCGLELSDISSILTNYAPSPGAYDINPSFDGDIPGIQITPKFKANSGRNSYGAGAKGKGAGPNRPGFVTLCFDSSRVAGYQSSGDIGFKTTGYEYSCNVDSILPDLCGALTPAPVTPSPVTPSPVTPSPTTPAPVTPAPVTPSPTTPAPVTPAPITPSPITPAPVTPAPVTPAPITPSPITPAPVTPAPVTPAPVTPAPITPAPVTPSPVTPAPITPSPITPAPVTPAPVTPAPVTPSPTTPAPVTPAPVTPAPITPAPITPAPVTPAPVTPSPITPRPTTPAPVTPSPVTPSPVTPSPVTPSPVTPAPITPAPVVCSNSVIGNDAIDITASAPIDETISGASTTDGTFYDIGFCGTTNTAPGKWYRLSIPNGNTGRVSYNIEAEYTFDTKLSIYTCNGPLMCVTGNDDASGIGTLSRVQFTGCYNEIYIHLHGFSAETGTTNIEITSSEILGACDGTPAPVTPSPVTPSGILTTAQKQEILDMHNQVRNTVADGEYAGNNDVLLPSAQNMNELLWDDGLAQLAKDYADLCISGHSYWNTDNLIQYESITSFELPAADAPSWQKYIGENLARASLTPVQFDNEYGVTGGVQGWIDEGLDYGYGTIPRDTASPTDEICTGSTCGHFTQVIWANTRYIGCAYTDCNGAAGFSLAMNLVCQYWDGGNFQGQYPYESGTACANCDGDRTDNCNVGDSNRDSLCGGGVDSSFLEDGTTDVDQCDNGLGQQFASCSISNPARMNNNEKDVNELISDDIKENENKNDDNIPWTLIIIGGLIISIFIFVGIVFLSWRSRKELLKERVGDIIDEREIMDDLEGNLSVV